jgi:hypothetical protein
MVTSTSCFVYYAVCIYYHSLRNLLKCLKRLGLISASMKENKAKKSSNNTSNTHSVSDYDTLQSSSSSSSHNIAVSETVLRLRPDAITIDIGIMHAQSIYTTGLVFRAVASGSTSPLLDAAHKVRVCHVSFILQLAIAYTIRMSFIRQVAMHC